MARNRDPFISGPVWRNHESAWASAIVGNEYPCDAPPVLGGDKPRTRCGDVADDRHRPIPPRNRARAALLCTGHPGCRALLILTTTVPSVRGRTLVAPSGVRKLRRESQKAVVSRDACVANLSGCASTEPCRKGDHAMTRSVCLSGCSGMRRRILWWLAMRCVVVERPGPSNGGRVGSRRNGLRGRLELRAW